MSYIYPHNNPEILKLGIRMALYREKKPEINYNQPQDDRVLMHEGEVKNWREQSFIAYLKEPEFKVGEMVYRKSDYKEIIFEGMKSDCSHYYPGQEYNGDINYVRKIGRYTSQDSILIDEKPKIEWQEVEEPEPMLIGETKYHEPTYEPNPKYTQFQEEINKAKILADI